MSRQPEKQARAEAMLGELAELSLMVARELAVQLRASEDVNETVALADAFQKVSRAMRLTITLDAKLDRDLARDARELEAEAANRRRTETVFTALERSPTETRKGRVRNLLNRLIWNESEGDSEDYEILLDDLSARLDEAALSDDFETLPIEVLAQRVMADMGLSGELTLSVGEAPARDPPAQQPQLADSG